jgi:hypothetical protein
MELQPVEINSGKQMTALLLLNFMMLSVSDYTGYSIISE